MEAQVLAAEETRQEAETAAVTVENTDVAEADAAPSKSQEASSGTDDDEPSAQPAIIPDDTDDINAVPKEMTVEERRTAFVNEGLIRWEAARSAWLGHRGSDDSGSSSARPTAVPLDVDKIIDVLFYASSREARAGNAKPDKFPRNVPLPQMVDILQGKIHVKAYPLSGIRFLFSRFGSFFFVSFYRTQICGKPKGLTHKKRKRKHRLLI